MSTSIASNAIVVQPKDEMIDFWIENKLNVLFIGRHGVGKTSMIIDGFKRNKLKYKYFSASTMDPFVDFIGVPKEVKDEKGSYLELVKPKDFRDDEVEAIFFDEFNRSHKKIRNAVMELIQFKTINGRPFPNLKIIWAAINPENDELATYDVEPLDQAQKDRFQIHIEIPYKPNSQYFKSKYGEDKTEASIDWWNNLPEELKIRISPRRLEDALKVHSIGGNIRHVLPPASNLEKLISSLTNGSPLKNLNKVLSENDSAKLAKWLADENNFAGVKSELAKKEYAESCLPLLEEEKLTVLISESTKAKSYVFDNFNTFEKTIETLANSSQNKKVKAEALKILTEKKGLASSFKKKVRISKRKTLERTLSGYTLKLNESYIVTSTAPATVALLPTDSLESLNSYAIANSYMTTIDKMNWMDKLISIIATTPQDTINVFDALHLLEYSLSRINASTVTTYYSKYLYVCNKMMEILNSKKFTADVAGYVKETYPNITYKIYVFSGVTKRSDMFFVI